MRTVLAYVGLLSSSAALPTGG